MFFSIEVAAVLLRLYYYDKINKEINQPCTTTASRSVGSVALKL